MSACPDCGRPIALSYEAWLARKGPDDEHLSCAAHTNLDDEDMWGDEAIPDCRMATILRLRSQLATALARVAELEQELAAKDACWHCKVCLLRTKPRCEVCPDECDDEACSEEGCRETREKEGKDG